MLVAFVGLQSDSSSDSPVLSWSVRTSFSIHSIALWFSLASPLHASTGRWPPRLFSFHLDAAFRRSSCSKRPSSGFRSSLNTQKFSGQRGKDL